MAAVTRFDHCRKHVALAERPYMLGKINEHGVILEFIKPGKPTKNAFIERFNRTYRTEILDFYLFRTLNEAREITKRWLYEYNSERPHESLNLLTWEEYQLMAENPEIPK
ncbi:hypothetical protein GCM10022405_07250 [Gibbsiella dentisursi]|uniref:Integrase catalytic domain-containing protein n=1 Tax=Gibbsiella dentisursi TaxID=796890 RepID=A0ABP7KP58_9GAMM